MDNFSITVIVCLVVLIVLSLLILRKVGKHSEGFISAKWGPAGNAGAGSWSSAGGAKACAQAFQQQGYDPNCQNGSNMGPSCSDYPLVYCDNTGIVTMSDNNSCPPGSAMAYSPDMCNSPVVSTGGAMCSMANDGSSPDLPSCTGCTPNGTQSAVSISPNNPFNASWACPN